MDEMDNKKNRFPKIQKTLRHTSSSDFEWEFCTKLPLEILEFYAVESIWWLQTTFAALDVCFTYTFSHASRHTLNVQDESSERNFSVQCESGSYSSLCDHEALLSATLPDDPVVFTVQVVLDHNTKHTSNVSDLHWRRICLLVSVLTGTFISKVQEQISVHI